MRALQHLMHDSCFKLLKSLGMQFSLAHDSPGTAIALPLDCKAVRDIHFSSDGCVPTTDCMSAMLVIQATLRQRLLLALVALQRSACLPLSKSMMNPWCAERHAGSRLWQPREGSSCCCCLALTILSCTLLRCRQPPSAAAGAPTTSTRPVCLTVMLSPHIDLAASCLQPISS